jgi:putative transposase
VSEENEPEVTRQIGVSDQTYYAWRKRYGGMKMDQKRLKELEHENGKLKKIVADFTLDNAIVREVASGNSRARPISERRLIA